MHAAHAHTPTHTLMKWLHIWAPRRRDVYLFVFFYSSLICNQGHSEWKYAYKLRLFVERSISLWWRRLTGDFHTCIVLIVWDNMSIEYGRSFIHFIGAFTISFICALRKFPSSVVCSLRWVRHCVKYAKRTQIQCIYDRMEEIKYLFSALQFTPVHSVSNSTEIISATRDSSGENSRAKPEPLAT